MCQRGHSLALCSQGVLITPIQPTKSKSLFELINLIQIRKRRRNFADFFSVVFAFDMFSSRENQGYYEFDGRFHTRVGESN